MIRKFKCVPAEIEAVQYKIVNGEDNTEEIEKFIGEKLEYNELANVNYLNYQNKSYCIPNGIWLVKDKAEKLYIFSDREFWYIYKELT